jgi:hypothetical protein
MDVLNRIKYDLARGGWKVLFGGREIKTPFKSAEEAHAHLEQLKGKKAIPEFA